MNVSPEELLARFLFNKDIRADISIKPEPFMPFPHLELSVTRQRELSENEIWTIGKSIAQKREKALAGRADIQAEVFFSMNLNVVPDPLPDNKNHANVTEWPREKSEQKSLAQEIAAAAGKAILAPN